MGSFSTNTNSFTTTTTTTTTKTTTFDELNSNSNSNSNINISFNSNDNNQCGTNKSGIDFPCTSALEIGMRKVGTLWLESRIGETNHHLTWLAELFASLSLCLPPTPPTQEQNQLTELSVSLAKLLRETSRNVSIFRENLIPKFPQTGFTSPNLETTNYTLFLLQTISHFLVHTLSFCQKTISCLSVVTPLIKEVAEALQSQQNLSFPIDLSFLEILEKELISSKKSSDDKRSVSLESVLEEKKILQENQTKLSKTKENSNTKLKDSDNKIENLNGVDRKRSNSFKLERLPKEKSQANHQNEEIKKEEGQKVRDLEVNNKPLKKILQRSFVGRERKRSAPPLLILSSSSSLSLSTLPIFLTSPPSPSNITLDSTQDIVPSFPKQQNIPEVTRGYVLALLPQTSRIVGTDIEGQLNWTTIDMCVSQGLLFFHDCDKLQSYPEVLFQLDRCTLIEEMTPYLPPPSLAEESSLPPCFALSDNIDGRWLVVQTQSIKEYQRWTLSIQNSLLEAKIVQRRYDFPIPGLLYLNYSYTHSIQIPGIQLLIDIRRDCPTIIPPNLQLSLWVTPNSLRPSTISEIRAFSPQNSLCSECERQNPDWVCLNYSALQCFECSSILRGLSDYPLLIKSLSTSSFNQEEINHIKFLGNLVNREVFEKNLIQKKPSPNDKFDLKEQWLREKYLKNNNFSQKSSESISLEQLVSLIQQKVFFF